MVSAKVDNYHTGIGFSGIVGSQGGGDLSGGGTGPSASLDNALLIGDSLTVGIKSTFEGKYPNAKAMGKGGKWATHWLQSLDELPDASSVSSVIQWLGINGVHNNKVNLRDSQALLTKLKEKYPDKPIFNMKIFPTTQSYGYNGYKGEWWLKGSNEFNSGMSSWASSNGVTQIDATNGLIKSDGYLDDSKTVDGIHFNSEGYKQVLSNIEQAIGSYNGSIGGGTTTTAASSIDELGVFGKLKSIGTGLVASIYNGKDVFDQIMNPNTNTGTTDGSTPSTGTPDISDESDTATAVWKFFTGKGYSKHATAGIMGNLYQESGLDPTKKQYGGGPGRGIGQWTVSEERFAGLQKHAQSKGKDWTDLQSQLEWIDMELHGKDRSTKVILDKQYGGIEKFKQATDYKWATNAFEDAFERAGDARMENRYKYAKNYYDSMTNAGLGPAMATSAQSDPGGIPDAMNGWKYYQQSDSKWAGKVGSSTVSRGGCGPTSAAMMLSTIFGKQINPLTMTKWAHKNGTWTGAMQWSMADKVSEDFGLKMERLASADGGAPASAMDSIRAALKSGKPVMMTGRGAGASGSKARTDTPFTPTGHVVLAVGVDGNGNVIINDPRGASRSKAYTDEGILNVGTGLRGAWAYDTSGGSIPSSITTDGDFTGGGTNTGDGTTDGTVSTTTPAIDELGVFGKLKSIGTGLVASIYNGKDVFDQIMNGTTVSAETTTTDDNSGSSPTGKGTFPKYNLNDKQIKGIANILQHEQPGVEGRHAEASLMANLVDIKGDSYATVDNLIKKATGGWFAKGKERFNNPGNPEQISIDAAKSVLVEGKRTLPRYVNEHDCFSDLTSVSNNGNSFKASDRSQYKQFVTKIKNRYGSSGTFHSFPNSKSDPFYYTSEEYRKKWGEDCYSVNAGSGDAGKGDGNTYLVNPNGYKHMTGHAGMGDGKATYTKSVTSNTGNNTADINAQRNLENINRKINVAFNNINASDPNAYTEILKLIVEELQAINSNTASTASSVSNIEIVSASTPVTQATEITTADVYKAGRQPTTVSKLQTINSTTGYETARQIAGYKKNK